MLARTYLLKCTTKTFCPFKSPYLELSLQLSNHFISQRLKFLSVICRNCVLSDTCESAGVVKMQVRAIRSWREKISRVYLSNACHSTNPRGQLGRERSSRNRGNHTCLQYAFLLEWFLNCDSCEKGEMTVFGFSQHFCSSLFSHIPFSNLMVETCIRHTSYGHVSMTNNE